MPKLRDGTPVLLDVTAVLTSATLNAVAEAFSVPANSSVAVVASHAMPKAQQDFLARLDDATIIDAPDPASVPVIGPQPDSPSSALDAVKVPVSRLASLRGMTLLQQLPLLDRATLSTFARGHPKAIADLIAHPPAAADVAAWWSAMPGSAQSMLRKTTPSLVGNLQGLPYATRDQANRSYLTQAESSIRAQLTAGVGRAAADDLNRQLHMLEQVRQSLEVGTSGNPRSLVGLDPSGEGTAVIIIGNATTADYVNYLIPGMFSSVDTQIVKFAQSADGIATDQQRWLKKLQPIDTPTVATFAWIGYHTPNLVNVTSLDLARQGQTSLASSIQGLRAVRAADQPYVAVLAHSYGSTAAMMALMDDDISIDALAIVGSPGSPAKDARQLKVTDGNVWVGAAEWDPVPQTGLFGTQPSSSGFGAHVFGVDGTTDPQTGKALSDAVSHNGYFVPGTESLRNIELIGIDRGDLVLAPNGSLALGGSSGGSAKGAAHAGAATKPRS